jgi:hypothetical protein
MKAHLVVIIVTALVAVTCGETFLLALFQQFGKESPVGDFAQMGLILNPSGS